MYSTNLAFVCYSFTNGSSARATEKATKVWKAEEDVDPTQRHHEPGQHWQPPSGWGEREAQSGDADRELHTWGPPPQP